VPELPEVETVRRGLSGVLVGRRIDSVIVTGRRSVRREPIESFVDRIVGARVIAADRRGKYLVLPLDSDEWMCCHLRMSGQLLASDPRDPLAPHTHVRMGLDDGTELRFVDPRTFGELYVVRQRALAIDAPELARMGPEPIGLSRRRFVGRMLARRTVVKGALLDQRVLAGIGNIYSDEICFAAKVRFDHPTHALSAHQLGRLWRATSSILDAAIEAGGSTLRDAQYVGVDGAAGSYAERFAVYAREGEHCVRCGRGVIRRAAFQQRSTFFCPRCQPPPTA
jgi:formamidopyrimidine-DNA glycosylase